MKMLVSLDLKVIDPLSIILYCIYSIYIYINFLRLKLNNNYNNKK